MKLVFSLFVIFCTFFNPIFGAENDTKPTESIELKPKESVEIKSSPKNMKMGSYILPNTIYKITSRNIPDGVLTVTNTSESSWPVTLEKWDNYAGQKWRVTESKEGVYDLYPTLNEDFVLEYEDEETGFSKFMEHAFNWGGASLWKIIYAGEGFFNIKNYRTKGCLRYEGLEMNVTAVKCNNGFEQQWKFDQL